MFVFNLLTEGKTSISAASAVSERLASQCPANWVMIMLWQQMQRPAASAPRQYPSPGTFGWRRMDNMRRFSGESLHLRASPSPPHEGSCGTTVLHVRCAPAHAAWAVTGPQSSLWCERRVETGICLGLCVKTSCPYSKRGPRFLQWCGAARSATSAPKRPACVI